ncbi:hypothetical protein DPMN_138060 [Dreissena polymorpha]|uniref:Uncharacterized protein n=1 Tax=Dreissena polymorpha TaxID=45954 RepID=A0A9D4G5X1_DREPO|nr:hypothetical protein DPMN_138060 [Dreissena polymorpha]
MCLMGKDYGDVQLLIDLSHTFVNEERYLLQPTKTAALNIQYSERTTVAIQDICRFI